MHEIGMFDRPGPLNMEGFEVAVVADATAAAQHPDLGDGYAAALTNFRCIASDVLTTEDALRELSR